MTLLQRITAVLERARVAGGWDDEEVGRDVLAEMRDPTGIMKTAGFYAKGIHWGVGATVEDAGDCYRAMVDTELSEKTSDQLSSEWPHTVQRMPSVSDDPDT